MAEVTEEARARVAKMLSDWDWPAPQTLEDIYALGEDAVPALIEVLTPELLADALVDDRADTILYYIMEMLADFQTPEAVAAFLAAFRHVSDDSLEYFDQTTRRLGPGAVEGLLSVASDSSLTYYPRVLAVSGAVSEACREPSLRPRVTEALRGLLSGYLAQPGPPTEDDHSVVDLLVVELAEMSDPDARPLIEAALRAGLVTPPEESPMGIPMIDEAGVEEMYQEGACVSVWTPKLFREEYPKRLRDHQEEQEKQKRLKLLDREAAPQPVLLDPKLGRNAPCWCGSGKKYKKCHLLEDEKDKVRL